MIDLVITGGKIATADGVFDGDVAIKDGLIQGIGSHGFVENASSKFNAEGKIVMPGAIDPHVHMKSKAFGTVTKDDFESGSEAGAYGGVTTIVDFAIPTKNQTPMEAIHELRSNADGIASIDYGLHSCLTDASEKTITEIKSIIEYGIPSFKMFMTYRKEGVLVDDGMLMEFFKEIVKHGGLPGVHAENDSMIERLTAKYLKEGKTTPKYHALSRPNIVEAEAINRAAYIADFHNLPIYIYHMSTKEGRDLLRKAQSNHRKIYGEVCTHHLTLTDELYEREDGVKYIMTPPLRKKEDVESLWGGLADGTIANIASDHSSWDLTQKTKGRNSFAEVPNGVAGVETRVPVIYSEGVGKNRFSLSQFVACVSTNPAKMFGLYPKKGTLAVGSDADITIIDPKLEVTLSIDKLHSRVDFTIYEGMKLKGYPITTISRGAILVRDGQFVGEKGHGMFVSGKPFFR